MTVNSRVIKTFLSWTPDAVDVPLMDGLRVQILPSIADLPRARKHQFAAIVASEGLLIVWDDNTGNLIQRAKLIETQLMELVWRAGEEEEIDEKAGGMVKELEVDEESGEILQEKRATHLINTILVFFTLIIVVVMLGAGLRSVAIEIAVDGNFIRLAFLALIPVQIFFTLVCPCLSPQSLTCTTLWSWTLYNHSAFIYYLRPQLTVPSSSRKSLLAVLRSALALLGR